MEHSAGPVHEDMEIEGLRLANVIWEVSAFGI